MPPLPARDPLASPDFEALRLRLSKLRQERGLTYDALAGLTGITRSTLIALETGARRANRPDKPNTRGSLESWWRIARALDIELVDLLSALDSDET